MDAASRAAHASAAWGVTDARPSGAMAVSPEWRGGVDPMPTREGRTQSMAPEQGSHLAELSWEQITDPGTYVEIGTRDLYRFPQEALVSGASPLITKQSAGASRLVKLSGDPFMVTLKARLLCAEHNIQPNF